MASESIREWLDADVKAGYGAKFASAFEEVGFEDTSDLQDMDDELMANLEQELVAADAKAVHLKKIKAAINAVVGNAPETRANLDAAKSTEVSTAETATSAAVVAASGIPPRVIQALQAISQRREKAASVAVRRSWSRLRSRSRRSQ